MLICYFSPLQTKLLITLYHDVKCIKDAKLTASSPVLGPCSPDMPGCCVKRVQKAAETPADKCHGITHKD